MQNSLLSERLAFLSSISPVAITSSVSVTSAYVQQTASQGNKFARYLGFVQVASNLTGTNKVTISLQKASDSSGTGATAVSTVDFVGTNSADVIQPIDFNPVAIDTSKPYIAIRATQAGTGTSTVAGVLLGGDGKYEPASTSNAADVAAALSNV